MSDSGPVPRVDGSIGHPSQALFGAMPDGRDALDVEVPLPRQPQTPSAGMSLNAMWRLVALCYLPVALGLSGGVYAAYNGVLGLALGTDSSFEQKASSFTPNCGAGHFFFKKYIL